MIRHLLAPVNAEAARGLGLPRSLPALAAEGAVALTFDDGPHPEGTPRMLEILAEHQAHATFFLIGEHVVRHPHLVRQIVDQGHAVALHGFHHRLQLRRGERDLRDDYLKGIAAIQETVGRAPALHRPPYGIYSASGLALARGHGLQPLLWSTWGKDWRRYTTPERIARRATRRLEPGGVILLHDADFYSSRGSHERTAQALPAILTELKSREIATVLPV